MKPKKIAEENSGKHLRPLDVLFSSKTGEWETPQAFFDAVQREFRLNVDVCATRENAKLRRYWTREDNGLSKDWRGLRCWMNPPYGRTIGTWIAKAASGDAEIVVGLLPARTDTRWFHDYIYNKAEVRFIKGRLKFGKSKNSAPFPSMLVIWQNGIAANALPVVTIPLCYLASHENGKMVAC